MEPRRDPLTLKSLPWQLPRWGERTVDARWEQLFELLRLVWSRHPDDAYSRSDLLVMAAEQADALDAQVLAERLFTEACHLREDDLLSARAGMLGWKLDRDEWEAMELSESWRRDRSCSVADHEELAGIWLDEGEDVYAWGWAVRGLMLAEELGLSGRATAGLVALRDEILASLGREPAPAPPDPGCFGVAGDRSWRTAA